MDKKELINIIYDTLFENTNHPQFNKLNTDNQCVGGELIDFDIDGITYTLTLQATHKSTP
ncbi:MAG: hypothetical protein KAS32_29750 [Candidatus Peribacteraceae bacterium]|nr:hypothetical protein [Candidatus Peribacteraceae bacterium]